MYYMYMISCIYNSVTSLAIFNVTSFTYTVGICYSLTRVVILLLL